MKTQQPLTVYRVLLEFSDLSKVNQQVFIELMNDFLMISPQRRREFIEQWRVALDRHATADTEHSN
ncbi:MULTISPECIES: hypothetical protein [Cupriavidus]|uniref:hypothetical protein n=1 Tax=Cupriavidus TaxID=106589 RepID=UPI00049146F8|nr:MULTISPECIES: hypothetical protein [Cupriavidus]